jgi:hypothetical protein
VKKARKLVDNFLIRNHRPQSGTIETIVAVDQGARLRECRSFGAVGAIVEAEPRIVGVYILLIRPTVA